MAIPLSYNLRNLKVRFTTTVMTALGIALTVAVLDRHGVLTDDERRGLASWTDPVRRNAAGLEVGRLEIVA